MLCVHMLHDWVTREGRGSYRRGVCGGNSNHSIHATGRCMLLSHASGQARQEFLSEGVVALPSTAPPSWHLPDDMLFTISLFNWGSN